MTSSAHQPLMCVLNRLGQTAIVVHSGISTFGVVPQIPPAGVTMATLEQLTPGTAVRGILPDASVSVVSVQ